MNIYEKNGQLSLISKDQHIHRSWPIMLMIKHIHTHTSYTGFHCHS